jgi:hypothetical protein
VIAPGERESDHDALSSLEGARIKSIWFLQPNLPLARDVLAARGRDGFAMSAIHLHRKERQLEVRLTIFTT